VIIDILPEEMDVEVVSAGAARRVRSTLTERQQAAVKAAVACGYYAVPREGSLSDVAEGLDCAESTVSILLRRADRCFVLSQPDAIDSLGAR